MRNRIVPLLAAAALGFGLCLLVYPPFVRGANRSGQTPQGDTGAAVAAHSPDTDPEVQLGPAVPPARARPDGAIGSPAVTVTPSRTGGASAERPRRHRRHSEPKHAAVAPAAPATAHAAARQNDEPQKPDSIDEAPAGHDESYRPAGHDEGYTPPPDRGGDDDQ